MNFSHWNMGYFRLPICDKFACQIYILWPSLSLSLFLSLHPLPLRLSSLSLSIFSFSLSLSLSLSLSPLSPPSLSLSPLSLPSIYLSLSLDATGKKLKTMWIQFFGISFPCQADFCFIRNFCLTSEKNLLAGAEKYISMWSFFIYLQWFGCGIFWLNRVNIGIIDVRYNSFN